MSKVPTIVPLSLPLLKVSTWSNSERYAYFLRLAADSAKVWGLLGQQGWVTLTDLQGQSSLPVWPDQGHACASAVGDWAGLVPACIGVREFVQHWLPNMGELDLRVNVFPTMERLGLRVTAALLELHLHEQLSVNAERPAIGTATVVS